MKITTWNANGVSRKNNQAKVDWLLTYLQLNPDIAVLALQETHCQDDSEYSQALHDIKLKYTVIHSPSQDGDGFAGVMLIISKEYKVLIEQTVIAGRVLYVRLESEIYGTTFDLISLYGYPSGRQDIMKDATDMIDLLTPTVILGDFNFVTDKIDRSSNTMFSNDTARANDSEPLFEALGMQDAFRLKHGDKREFSYIKTSSKSRIDRIYVNESLQNKILQCKHIAVLGRERDHLMVEVEIDEEIKRGKGYWKFNTSLLKDNEYSNLIKGTIDEAKQELRNGEWDNIEDW